MALQKHCNVRRFVVSQVFAQLSYEAPEGTNSPFPPGRLVPSDTDMVVVP